MYRACSVRASRGIRMRGRAFGMLSALEEPPMKANLAPIIPTVSFENGTTANGIKYATRNIAAPVVKLNFSIMGGSSAEELSQKGAAHLLAVAALAGTSKRSGIRLCRDLENLGSTITTSADREKISISLTVLADKVDAAVQAVAEAITSPPSSPYTIIEMKDTASLIYTKLEDAKIAVQELLHEAAYGEETALGGAFMPSKKGFEDLSLEDVMAYRNKTFMASNMVVTGSGISSANLKVLLETHLHELPVGVSKPAVAASDYVGGDVRMKAELGGAACIGLAFHVPPAASCSPALLLKDLIASKHKSITTSLVSYSTGSLLSFVITESNPHDAKASLESLVANLKLIASSSATGMEGLRKKISIDRVSEYEGVSFVTVSLPAAKAGSISPSSSALSVMDVTTAALAQATKGLIDSVPSYVVYGRTAGCPNYAAVLKMLK